MVSLLTTIDWNAKVFDLHLYLISFFPDHSHCPIGRMWVPLQKLKWVFWIIFAGVLLFLVIYLLLMPMVLYVNTLTNEYYVQLKGLAKVSAHGDPKEFIRLRLKIFFLNFNFYPLKKKRSAKKRKSHEKRKKRRMGFKKMIRLVRTFKVRRFMLNIDSGDCITNAKLYPVFSLLNYGGGNFNINFEGRNQLVLQLQNRPIDLIKSFINV